MTIEQFMETCLEEKQRIEAPMLKDEKEVPLGLFLEWRACLQKMGERLADAAFCTIAKKYDAYILSNPVNSASYAHFLRSDVQSKTFSIRARTLREGIRNGFLAADESEFQAKPLDFWIQGQRFHAVVREGKECLVKELGPSDERLQVACYESGLLITSDIDLISIVTRDPSDDRLFDPVYGELTGQELVIIKEVNLLFRELTASYSMGKGHSSYLLIAHGPANRFSQSKASHLHFPMKVCTPHGSVEFLSRINKEPPQSDHQDMSENKSAEANPRLAITDSSSYFSIETDFLAFNRHLKSLGYHVHHNEKWGFVPELIQGSGFDRDKAVGLADCQRG